MNNIIRTVCYFSETADDSLLQRLNEIVQKIKKAGFEVQTTRICTKNDSIQTLSNALKGKETIACTGTITQESLSSQLESFSASPNVFANIDLTRSVDEKDTQFLYTMINKNPKLTFRFTYVVNNPPSSPFFPSSTFSLNGYSIGLQSTDLSGGCTTLSNWCEKMRNVWEEIMNLVGNDRQFLGIDSSIAPMWHGPSSLVNIAKRFSQNFSHSVTTPFYTQLSKFIKERNPKPIGLCGIMYPCLEDFELADEYEQGNFSIERNIFLSLHCGLGIDTYPIGTDEKPERVMDVLQLLRNLSIKYKKPLSARFVSDGKAKIGEKTDFKNQFLKDVTIQPL